MNAEMRKVSLCADFPKEFTFFDQLSVLHQSKDYDEIFFPNGILEDYIDNSIELEINELPRKDKIILWYSNCHSELGTNMKSLMHGMYVLNVSMTLRIRDMKNCYPNWTHMIFN